ncbi:MAG: sulfotransferase [Bdellovibrionales bacterium]
MIQNPVFIVGTERSGSNLLRLLLNEMPEVAIPHPPHLMRDLSPLLGRYGSLNNDGNFRRLIHDAVQLVNWHFSPWPLRPDPEKIFRTAEKRTLYAVCAAIYEQYRLHSGKSRWGCKSTFMIHHVSEILRHHKNPQFIHLVRDVRDVAVSARASVFCHYHPYFVAELWRTEQQRGLVWSKKLPENQWFTLRYEDLIRKPEPALRALCRFLDTRYSSEMLQFFKKEPAQELAGLSRSWSNVAQPVLSGNSGKFAKHLKKQDLLILESVCAGTMQRFGYKPITRPKDRPRKPGAIARAEYTIRENLTMAKEELRALVEDRNSFYRLRKKALLMSFRF